MSVAATSQNDAVFKPGVEAARKQWGQPQMTQIISALGNAQLQTATTTIGPDEPDAGKKAQLPVVKQSSVTAVGSAMGTTVTVQSPTVTPQLGVTVVKSSTSDSPKTVIVRKNKIDENKEDDSQAQATVTLSGKTEEETKTAVALETISEGTKETDKEDTTVETENTDDIGVEDVEDVTEEKLPEAAIGEKSAPKSPLKAWGEVKENTSTEGRTSV